MKFSYTLVAALVGAVAGSPIGEPSPQQRAVKKEVDQLSQLIANFQEAKNKKQESKGEGWQQTIDLLKERAVAIEAAQADQVAEEIKKLDEPLARIRKSREGAIDRYTRSLFGFADAKDRLTEAAK